MDTRCDVVIGRSKEVAHRRVTCSEEIQNRFIMGG